MNLPALETWFGLANSLALLGWAALVLAPLFGRHAGLARRFAGRVVPLLLAVAYAGLIATHWGTGGYGSLQQVQQLFSVPGLLLAGWLHYLAFDLFVGNWIAERAVVLGLRAWVWVPLLALTFLFGPAGLLGYALVRGLAAGRARLSAASL
ncbi:ABA4-like family protein [Schlegelella sp. S2-27]|uniref:ABA4-like family protein n=1 Tax=Caldimonas mangrovi TaxID=2944811 RepID=A0ABT0YJP1_9BURK|nr:ABA4-like family protein [Caldimonas mangrovi]MCM5678950.1 ABA4-like family protein [Caldimonas mangrovi]